MKKKLIIILTSCCLCFTFVGCSNLFAPEDENNRGKEDMVNDPAFAEGLLLNAYVRLPNNYSFDDVATDDAVTNDVNNNYLKMATGQWSAMMNPMNQWERSYTSIQYLNMMLEDADNIEWATTGEGTKELFNDRIKGECYGLRALNMYYLLQAHAGRTADGRLMGVPILVESQNGESNFNLPRDTFEDCVEQIYSDLSKAESYLPLDYEDIADASQLPSKYAHISYTEYNRVFGSYNRQRMSGRIAKAIRSKVALLAASPAFGGTEQQWKDAADYAGEVLDLNGGLSGMASNGFYWYARENSAEIGGLGDGNNPKEILWRTNVEESNNLETENFPPSLYGNGRINPTQNLVDAFPMQNGYPITDKVNGKYNESRPYTSRDPRLAKYIVTNGSTMGPSDSQIYTEMGKTDDGINAISTSTRTGYYMRKLLREDVNLNPVSSQKQVHYYPRIRYTEIFLNYAEASNRAWGPDGNGEHGYSARDVIAAIRQRAGIAQPDTYLESINTMDEMEELIRNERRLELCFEGFRFWDLRRWETKLTEAAQGVRIMGTLYADITVENRVYQNYMNYGPLPYEEILKWDQLLQNKGW